MKKMLTLLGQAFLGAQRIEIPESERTPTYKRFTGHTIDYLKLISSNEVQWFVQNNDHIVDDSHTGKAAIIVLLQICDVISPLNSRVYYFHSSLQELMLMSFGHIRINIHPKKKPTLRKKLLALH